MELKEAQSCQNPQENVEGGQCCLCFWEDTAKVPLSSQKLSSSALLCPWEWKEEEKHLFPVFHSVAAVSSCSIDSCLSVLVLSSLELYLS